MTARAKPILKIAVAACWLAAAVPPSPAEDWMFRRSYYTHAPLPAYDWPSPELSRSAYRRAYIGAGPGFAIRGGWRYNTIVLQSGNSTDVTIQRENWFEATP
jgi:hypothetical protein